MSTMEKIDCFIDSGLEFESSTGKKFNYKEILKKTYKHLKNKGIEIPKQIQKDVQKLISERIRERFFSKRLLCKITNEENSEENSFNNVTLDRYNNSEPDCNDSMRGSVVGFGVGVVMVCSRNRVAMAAGWGIMIKEGYALFDETKAYLSRSYYGETRDSRDRDQKNHKDNNKRSLSRD